MTKIKTIILSGLGVLAAVTVLSLSIKEDSLVSLKANASGVKCIKAKNVDCLSPSTGNIYTGYKKATIGGQLEEM